MRSSFVIAWVRVIGLAAVVVPGASGAAPAGSSSSSGAPRITAEIPDLAASAPALADLLRWAALAEPELGPARIGARFEAAVGVDPLSPTSLRAAGVDPSKPVRITVDDVRRQLVVEVSLLDPAKARQHAEAMRAKVRGAAPVLGGAGFVVGGEPSESLALVVRDKDAVLVLGEGYKAGRVRTASTALAAVDPAKDRRLDYALGKRKRGTPPRPAKALLEGERVDLWAVVEPEDGAERIDVVVRARPGELRVDGEVALELGPEVVLGEGVRGTAASARLVEAGPLAADARTTLSRAGLREILGRLGVPEALAASLAGPVHAGVTADGTVFAAATLAPKADPEPLSKALAAALRGRAEVAVVGGVLTARIGDSVLQPAVPPGAGAPARGALAIDAVPAAVLSAVERQRTLLGIKPMQLMMVRVLMARLVAATQSVTVDASMPSNRIKGSVRMKYTLPAP